MLGLVLTAGGARGAYQAGVLKRLSELPALRDRPLFDASYTRTLVDIGYRDAGARASEIEDLIAGSGALERRDQAAARSCNSAKRSGKEMMAMRMAASDSP